MAGDLKKPKSDRRRTWQILAEHSWRAEFTAKNEALAQLLLRKQALGWRAVARTIGSSRCACASATHGHSAPDDVVVVAGLVKDLPCVGSIGVHDADVFGRAVVGGAGEDDATAVG